MSRWNFCCRLFFLNVENTNRPAVLPTNPTIPMATGRTASKMNSVVAVVGVVVDGIVVVMADSGR